MLTMDKIHDIRFRFFVKGENISQIAVALQLDWKTVQKYVDMTDFNEPAPEPGPAKLCFHCTRRGCLPKRHSGKILPYRGIG